MGFLGLIIKAILFSLIFCGWSHNALNKVRAISTFEMQSHYVPVNYNPYAQQSHKVDDKIDDSFVEESIKTENRQQYDIVNDASNYNPEANTNCSQPCLKVMNGNQNTSHTKSFSREQSAVIQTIPRKVHTSGSVPTSSTTVSAYTRRPIAYDATKNYRTADPTTTIVYATSIPTPSSRTFVNIRPLSLLPTQKYRSTLSATTQKLKETTESTKAVIENTFEDGKDYHQEKQQSPEFNVLEKPAFEADSNFKQGVFTSGTYDQDNHNDHRKRNLYKTMSYLKIRTNEDVENMPAYKKNSYLNPYSNHKWANQEFVHRMPLTPPGTAASTKMDYENTPESHWRLYQTPLNQKSFSTRFPAADEYQNEMYRPMKHSTPVYVPQPQPFSNNLSQQQNQQRQAHHPLTVRDFELLLQLLVLRERRLSGAHDSYLSTNYNGFDSDDNFYRSTISSNEYLKKSDLFRSGNQQSSVLLPPNVREELLFRMLLLAIHTQPQSNPMTVVRSPPSLPSQFMFLDQVPATSPRAPYLGILQHSGGITKSPIRSVQVLGEID